MNASQSVGPRIRFVVILGSLACFMAREKVPAPAQ
jgi:hypothetical protein